MDGESEVVRLAEARKLYSQIELDLEDEEIPVKKALFQEAIKQTIEGHKI